MAHSTLKATPIDAVILWVDGNDKKHQAKILPHLNNANGINSLSFNNRFKQVNEIKFAVDSIYKFAPYIRNIFIVTDNQTPHFLKTKSNNNYNKVSIVDHKTIFKDYEHLLPTFNSRSIETFMFRIPNLAEHFVYFNDDFFLINKTVRNDFFKEGLPVLRGKWLNFDNNSFVKKFKKPRVGHKTAQQKGAKIAGFKNYYNFHHTPHPFRKATFEACFKANKNLFLENAKYKLRSGDQILMQSLINHTEIKNKSCVLKKDIELLFFRSYKKPLIWYKFLLTTKGKNKKFLTLQNLDRCPTNILPFILKWITKRTL